MHKTAFYFDDYSTKLVNQALNLFIKDEKMDILSFLSQHHVIAVFIVQV